MRSEPNVVRTVELLLLATKDQDSSNKIDVLYPKLQKDLGKLRVYLVGP